MHLLSILVWALFYISSSSLLSNVLTRSGVLLLGGLQSANVARAYQVRRSSAASPSSAPKQISPKGTTTTPTKTRRFFRRLLDYEDYPPIVDQTQKVLPPKRRNWLSATPKIPISDVEELRSAILDQQLQLKQLEIQKFAQAQVDGVFSANVDDNDQPEHEVLQLMKERFESCSTPGNRTDDAILALAIEGGGMRGCVSAGMAAAIASLGLSESVDRIYGSSAGSVIGAYMVSRQMCMDVYVDILPAAKEKFVCKKRMVSAIAKKLVSVMITATRKSINYPGLSKIGTSCLPGMNISLVLDGILDQASGCRPLDFTKFEENNKHQQLRVVSSCVDEKGRLVSRCFGTEDFFGPTAVSTVDGRRKGLFACLSASMTVPGATGPPVHIVDKSSGEKSTPCFDAFCFEPIPYRSAVEEGATHVLALCSRPADFTPKTQPGVYEQGVAPLYFHVHGYGNVASFFEKGGQQYIYAEDLLLLEQARKTPNGKVSVPPPEVLYAVDPTTENQRAIHDRHDSWKQAHLLPLKVPPGTPELPSLEQDQRAVLEAVRGGFAAAFDMLAPIVGLEPGKDCVRGAEAARLVFPEEDVPPCSRSILETQLHVPGEPFVFPRRSQRMTSTAISMKGGSVSMANADLSHTLLQTLPGFQDGRFSHLAKGLKYGTSLNRGDLAP